MARDCTNAAKLRACYLCAQFGHDGRDCPNQLCWKCQRPGHQSRDCPNLGHKRPRTWEEEDNPTICLRCGREDCSCAGFGDYVRAEGGCTASYLKKDLQKIRCFVCGHRGHLGCGPTTGEQAKPSCFTCGEGGHTADVCRRDPPMAVRAERQHDRGSGRYNDRSSGGGGGGGGGGHGRYQTSQYGDDRGRYGGGDRGTSGQYHDRGGQYRSNQDQDRDRGRSYSKGYDTKGSHYRDRDRGDRGGGYSYGSQHQRFDDRGDVRHDGGGGGGDAGDSRGDAKRKRRR